MTIEIYNNIHSILFVVFLHRFLQEQKTDPIYEGCGETKTCFGFPDGCVGTKSCRTVATSTVRGESYEFEIKSSPGENPSYVAVALSTDDKMGDDSVMECVPEAGNIRAYTSWTLPRPNLGVTRQGIVSKFPTFYNS